MQWISKDPPIYVWKDDKWFNERDKCVYIADLEKKVWRSFDNDSDQSLKTLPFTKKTRIMEKNFKK